MESIVLTTIDRCVTVLFVIALAFRTKSAARL